MTRKGRKGERFETWLCRQQGVLPPSALRYTLEALVPLTKANLEVTFKPGKFFNSLEKINHEKHGYSRETIRQAYFAAKRRGLIVVGDGGRPSLSDDAQHMLKPFESKKLKHASVMVVFDIPLSQNHKRRWFRLLLKELKFVQIQQSVWLSEYDCFEVLSSGILEQQLEQYVRVFEARAVEN